VPPVRRSESSWGRDNVGRRRPSGPERLPASLCWSRWEALGADPVESEVVVLGESHCAHRYLDRIQASIVGFSWGWD
jgi:hypothetical protein